MNNKNEFFEKNKYWIYYFILPEFIFSLIVLLRAIIHINKSVNFDSKEEIGGDIKYRLIVRLHVDRACRILFADKRDNMWIVMWGLFKCIISDMNHPSVQISNSIYS